MSYLALDNVIGKIIQYHNYGIIARKEGLKWEKAEDCIIRRM